MFVSLQPDWERGRTESLATETSSVITSSKSQHRPQPDLRAHALTPHSSIKAFAVTCRQSIPGRDEVGLCWDQHHGSRGAAPPCSELCGAGAMPRTLDRAPCRTQVQHRLL